MCEVAQKLVSASLFCFQDLKPSTKDIITVLKDILNTTLGPLPIPDPHVTWVPFNTSKKHSIGSRVVDGVRNLIITFNMARLVGFPTLDSTFTYRRELRTPHLWICYSAKALWISILSTKSLTSFLNVVFSERISIITRVTIVDNTKLAIQVGRHTPRVVIFDIGAQPMILRIQFAKKMGMLDSKLRKSMWRIRTANGSIEEVLGESSNFIALNFNEGTY
jgi:hypothetical protein